MYLLYLIDLILYMRNVALMSTFLTPLHKDTHTVFDVTDSVSQPTCKGVMIYPTLSYRLLLPPVRSCCLFKYTSHLTAVNWIIWLKIKCVESHGLHSHFPFTNYYYVVHGCHLLSVSTFSCDMRHWRLRDFHSFSFHAPGAAVLFILTAHAEQRHFGDPQLVTGGCSPSLSFVLLLSRHLCSEAADDKTNSFTLRTLNYSEKTNLFRRCCCFFLLVHFFITFSNRMLCE